jgi:hypothetical protein
MWSRSIKNMQVAMIQTRSFSLRALQSSIAVATAKSLFEECGYQVRHTGFEFAVPEWRTPLLAGEPSPSALWLRSLPDITVYDEPLNCIYEVEVKTTEQASQVWRYGKERLDRLRSYHPTAHLMVFRQRSCDFLCQRVDHIDWERQAMSRDRKWYDIDLPSTFESPPAHFPSMSNVRYVSALEQIRRLLSEFVPSA